MTSKKPQQDISGLFVDFQKLCIDLDKESKYSEKTSILAKNFKVWKGDVFLLCKLLLCKNDLRKYNIREKSAVKILSRYLNAPFQEMLSDLEHGDMPETARKFFVKYGTPIAKSNITLKQIDEFLQELTTVRTEDAQYNVFSKILPKITADDLKILMKIIDHDLKINIGPKYVLGALHPDAFNAYRNSNNLEMIIERVMNQEAMEKKDGGGLFSDLGVDGKKDTGSSSDKGGGFLTGLSLMTPVKPMLALACHSMNEVISRCQNGMYSEIKYDGWRIQIHKKGNDFKCYSRNLKPLPDWKVEQVREFIPKATKADSIILDGEILLMDTINQKPLPFGTLGVHKQTLFKDACVCVFLFDILYINGKTVMHKSLRKRRKIMEKHIKPVKNRVEFSEMIFVNKEEDLCLMMTKVMQEGLEGLVIKDIKSIYEPGSRHWIKLKKDYLQGMADSADMVVIGANFGSGSKGGLLSTFLMGVHDPKTNKWKTVCKVGNGHDDDTLKELQAFFKPKMVKVDRDFTKAPDWLDIDRTVVPDFIIKDPKKSAVWEVVGSEFTQSKKHTAAAISIRFPRVIRIRDDKDWKTATNLQELVDLSQASKADLKVPSSKKGKKEKATKKYRPITTDADESSSSDDDTNSTTTTKTTTTTSSTSIFTAKTTTTKSGSFNSIDSDDDDNDPIVSSSSSASNNAGASGKKGKYVHKPKSNQPPKILYYGDGKEGQTDSKDMGPKLTTSKKVHYMVGDVTSPSGMYIDENMLICHIADDSGKWSDKGVFAAISQKWEYPEQVFKKHASVLGDAQIVKISNSTGKGNLYVSTLIAQQSRSHKLNLEAFVVCLKHLAKFALSNNCSVHLPKLKMPNMTWAEIQGLLTTYLTIKSVPTYVYTVGRDTGKQKPTTPAAPAPAPKKPILPTQLFDEDEKRDSDSNSNNNSTNNNNSKQPLSKKRSLDEDEFKSSSSPITSTKKAKVDLSSVANPFLQVDEGKDKDKDKNKNNKKSESESESESEEEEEEEEEDDDDFTGIEYDREEESDEEADTMRSLILEDFVMSQKSSGSGTLDFVDFGYKNDNNKNNNNNNKNEEEEEEEGNGEGDDTISMDSDELEAFTRSTTATSSIGFSNNNNNKTVAASTSTTTTTTTTTSSKDNNNNNNNGKSKSENSRPFQGLRIVFSGFSEDAEAELGLKARELGAEISPQWFQVGPLKCTHLICGQHTSQIDSILMMGGSAYTEKWILDCHKSKTKHQEHAYVYKKKIVTKASVESKKSNETPKPITVVHLPQIFTELVIYMHGDCDKSGELKSLIKEHGGEISDDISEDVTHILSENKKVDMKMREPCPDATVVLPKWAWDSIKKQALLSERPFIVK